jgi:hypothetical protein
MKPITPSADTATFPIQNSIFESAIRARKITFSALSQSSFMKYPG